MCVPGADRGLVIFCFDPRAPPAAVIGYFLSTKTTLSPASRARSTARAWRADGHGGAHTDRLADGRADDRADAAAAGPDAETPPRLDPAAVRLIR